MSLDIDEMRAKAVAVSLENAFRADGDRAIRHARAWSRGSALFLADRLGPATAYEIASRSADDIITESACELAVPIEAAPERRADWRDAVAPYVGPGIVFIAIIGLYAAGFF